MENHKNKSIFEKQLDEFDKLAGEWSDHFEKSIKSESIRAKVILSACYLDELLNQLLEIVLKPNQERIDPLFDGPQAPLSTFSAKIDLVYRMGIISNETKKSLHLVRKIRNKFAHSLNNCDFSDGQIQDWNAELNKLNNVASPKRRSMFSDGAIGDFEKSISWLVYWIRTITQKIPSNCPNCGSEIEHRSKLKHAKPGENS